MVCDPRVKSELRRNLASGVAGLSQSTACPAGDDPAAQPALRNRPARPQARSLLPLELRASAAQPPGLFAEWGHRCLCPLHLCPMRLYWMRSVRAAGPPDARRKATQHRTKPQDEDGNRGRLGSWSLSPCARIRERGSPAVCLNECTLFEPRRRQPEAILLLAPVHTEGGDSTEARIEARTTLMRAAPRFEAGNKRPAAGV